MTKQLDLRFAIGSDETGPVSAIWRVWSSNSGDIIANVYGRHCSIAKLILHPSTQPKGGRWCNFGPNEKRDKESTSELESGRKRPLASWRRPESPIDAALPAFMVIVPQEFLRPREAPIGAVTWIVPPGEGMATCIVFAFTRAADTEPQGWQQVLATQVLPNGETVIIAVGQEPFDVKAFEGAYGSKMVHAATPGFLAQNQNAIEAENLFGFFAAAPPSGTDGCAVWFDIGRL